MIFIGYRIIFIALYMSISLASYGAPCCYNLKRKLKESCSEVWKTKRYTFDITVPTNHLQRQIFEKRANDLFTVQATNKDTISEKNKSVKCNTKDQPVEDRMSLISSNPQANNDTLNRFENKLSNSQSKIIKEKLIIATNSESTISNLEEKCWKNLLATTGQKKIRHHYKRLMQQQLDNVSVYSYSNSTFLNNFLKFPSPIFTADSIRVRFGSGFLNFLSTDQLIRVLAILLSSDLELTSAERCELVETIFGHIDLSLDMNFNNDQIVSIVTALLRSDVPYCFEQVFLTWKMWKVFTIEEQEKMLEGVINGMEYKQETLVMLYLFVLNRDATNSSKCEILKEHIIKIYGGSKIFDNVNIIAPFKYIEENLLVSDTLDTSLLDLQNKVEKLNGINLTKFKKFVRQRTSAINGKLFSTHLGKRYKIHICYALAKFTNENAQNSNEDVIDVYDNMYFNLEYIRIVFIRWTKASTNASHLANEREENELRNTYGAVRQLVQSKGYDSVAFLRLFRMVNTHDFNESLFALALFSLTKEVMLREINKTTEWAEYVKNRDRKYHGLAYVENLSMDNADLNSKLFKPYCLSTYVEKLTNIFLRLINLDKKLYRERYLYQKLPFQFKFTLFNNMAMELYISSLNKISQFDDKKRRIKIARNFIFSEYYHKSTVGLKLMSIGVEESLEKFRISFENECERYENERDIENKGKALKTC